MDYEVFLLMAIREEHLGGARDDQAVATGLAKTAGLISSAALIMVCLFSSFALTRLAATKTFGLGLAFAVGLDATLVRLALVPALMELFGAANWWFPGRGAGSASKAKPWSPALESRAPSGVLEFLRRFMHHGLRFLFREPGSLGEPMTTPHARVQKHLAGLEESGMLEGH